jgi:hypothetical protein
VRQFGYGVAVGLALAALGALYSGGEAMAQAGLRLAAIEQGFALAGRHWQFEAVPELAAVAEAGVAAQAAPAPRKAGVAPASGRRPGR